MTRERKIGLRDELMTRFLEVMWECDAPVECNIEALMSTVSGYLRHLPPEVSAQILDHAEAKWPAMRKWALKDRSPQPAGAAVRINVNAPQWLKGMMEDFAEERGVIPGYFIKPPEDTEDDGTAEDPS
jgi:hypothetical protein